MRVLVVEDEECTRLDIAGTLRAHGLEVLEACNAFDALEFLIKGQIDAVVLDWILPCANGDMLLDEAKRRGLLNCPVVVMTAHSLDRLTNLPSISRVLRKPVESEEIARIVSQLVT